MNNFMNCAQLKKSEFKKHSEHFLNIQWTLFKYILNFFRIYDELLFQMHDEQNFYTQMNKFYT